MNSSVSKAKIAVIGGDLRQIYTAYEFAKKGYETAIYGFDKFDGKIDLCTKCTSLSDAINKSTAVILPNPVTNDSKTLFTPLSDNRLLLSEIFKYADDSQLMLGGRVSCLESEYSKRIIDYFEMEELVIANAYLTAESAVGIALNEMKVSIKDVNVLVVGFGRIGKCLCSLLKGMGVNVFASARKERDFAWIRAYGYSPVETGNLCSVVSSCDLIFNTVPELVLCEDSISCMKKDCVIIDLASKPGGVDFDAALSYGIKTVWALALPGKKLPVSAGRVQAKTILNFLDDKGVI